MLCEITYSQPQTRILNLFISWQKITTITMCCRAVRCVGSPHKSHVDTEIDVYQRLNTLGCNYLPIT